MLFYFCFVCDKGKHTHTIYCPFVAHAVLNKNSRFSTTKKVKNTAQAATYFAFVALYFVLAIYGFVKMIDVGKKGNGSISATISVIVGIFIFGIGFCGVLYGIFIFKPKIKRIVKDADKSYKATLDKMNSQRSAQIESDAQN